MTSVTRRITPLHALHSSVTSSMNGRCRSSSTVRPTSAVLPAQNFSSHDSQTQMGSGVPQYRLRDRFQSMRLSSQFPMRPSRMCAGCQSTLRLLAISRSLTAVVRMNHESTA